MKKKYEKPKVSVTEFAKTDIITDSVLVSGGSEGAGPVIDAGGSGIFDDIPLN